MNQATPLFIAAGLLFSMQASGEPAQPACHVLQGADVWLPDGLAKDIDVRIDGDRLTVGASGEIAREGCRVQDLSGRVITPGFVEPNSRMGLVEVELEGHTDDSSSGEHWEGDGNYRASFQVWRGINPRSQAIPASRVEGITSAVVMPRGALFSGQASWIDLSGRTQSEVVKGASVAQVVKLGAQEKSSRALSLHRFVGALEEAKAFREREGAWLKGEAAGPSIDREELHALYRVVDREIPVVFFADRASDLENIANSALDYGFKAIVVGGAEGWLVSRLLLEAGISVIIDPLLATGRSFDQLHGRPDNGRLLREAGVPVMFSSFETHNARTLRQVAGNAVREGMSPEDAMRAITIEPALAFGMSRHGRLETGMYANLVVWSGDPFELSVLAEQVWIGGERISLETRQTLLRDKYIQRLGLIKRQPQGRLNE